MGISDESCKLRNCVSRRRGCDNLDARMGLIFSAQAELAHLKVQVGFQLDLQVIRKRLILGAHINFWIA